MAGGIIIAVEPGSPAALAGIKPGERLLAIDGRPIRDLIDYLAQSAQSRPLLTLDGPDGERRLRIEKREEDSLGLSFAGAVFDGIRRCGNKCVFCFVDQLPKGMRESLYIKDEDYRLSFLQGNYVTLTRLSRADERRIIEERLSPLYVSVHATDPGVRGKMLGLAKDAPILPLLSRLTRAGIAVQAQAVICPGWNDGAVLDRTIEDLAAFRPGLRSLAVVPVGLTAHRRGLTPLKAFDAEDARVILRQIEIWQERLYRQSGTRFVFAADEFYVLAGRAWPGSASYEDYPQLENGVGLLRSFEDEFRAAWRRWRRRIRPGRIRVVTGQAAAGMWSSLARLTRRAGLEISILAVPNRFFGESVTVTGLLTGRDIVAALHRRERMPTFVPRILLQRGADRFLDGLSLAEFTDLTAAEVIETDASVFLDRAARILAHDR